MDVSTLAPGQEFGNYRIARRIGHGGMGEVFEAEQLDLDRRVALKVLAAQFGAAPEFRERFRREAALLARLDSPHIITIHAHGETDGRLWIATQLVRGGDLKALIGSHGLQLEVALDLMIQVCSGLADAHEAHVLHRDVKPSNILVRDRSGQLHAYLGDFGIARATDDERTSTGTAMGTLAYMAPERHQGSEASVASDLYAVGCVLWAALTGGAPYGGTSEVEVALGHIQKPLPLLPATYPQAAALNRVLSRVLAKDPAQRHRDARELCADLLALRAAASHSSAPEQITVAAAASTSPVAPPGAAPAPAQRSSTSALPAPRPRRAGRAVGLAAVAVLAVGGAAVAGMQLGWADRSEERTGDGAPSAAEDVTAPETTTAPETAAARARDGDAGASTVPEPAGGTASPPARATGPADVVCWDGAREPAAARCRVPEGRLGMSSVFPALHAGCTAQRTSVAGKLEVFTCEASDHLIRYTRWDPDVDRTEYYMRENSTATSEPWLLDGEVAGTAWTSFEEDESRDGEPWQWSATYADHPYSVSVESTTAAGRAQGIAAVRAVHPSGVGLAQAPGAS